MAVKIKSKYYLAGPMTGIEGYNFKRFDEFAKELRARNYEVISPAEIARTLPGEPGDLPYQEYVRADLKGLLQCSDLILIPGWRASRGAMMELNIADFLKMRVWTINSDYSLKRENYGDTSV